MSELAHGTPRTGRLPAGGGPFCFLRSCAYFTIGADVVDSCVGSPLLPVRYFFGVPLTQSVPVRATLPLGLNGLRSIARLVAIFLVASFTTVGLGLVSLLRRRPIDQRLARARWVHRMSPWFIRSLGVRLSSRNRLAQAPSGAGMTVANHISYVDIFLLAAQRPAVFVTSTDVEEPPVIGFLCRLGGCVFVDRRSARALRRHLSELADLMRAGVHVIVFPEATTSYGNGVLPFKAALFESVRLSGRPLWVACVEYPAHEQQVAGYVDEDDTVPKHLRRMVAAPGLSPCITWVAHEPEPARLDARALAHWSREAVVSAMAGAPSE